MDGKKKDYNLRTHISGKKPTSPANERKEVGGKNTINSTSTTSHGAILPHGATGGATGGAAIMDTSAIASTTDASDSSMHDVSDSTPAPISHELKTFMSDIKEMFRNFTSQVNTKLDSVINEIAELKTDLEKTKTTVSDMEVSLTNNSDRLLTVEQKSLPDLRKYSFEFD